MGCIMAIRPRKSSYKTKPDNLEAKLSSSLTEFLQFPAVQNPFQINFHQTVFCIFNFDNELSCLQHAFEDEWWIF